MTKRIRANSASPTPSEIPGHNAAAPHAVKYVHVDGVDPTALAPVAMKCQLPGHKTLQFASYDEYDVHYRQHHVHRCSECSKNFPSDLLLDLHLTEVHDPINAVRKARGERIYSCFADGCDMSYSEPRERRRHMVANHHFPKDYDFAIIKNGIDGRSSMLRAHRGNIGSRKPAAGAASNRPTNAKEAGRFGVQLGHESQERLRGQSEAIEMDGWCNSNGMATTSRDASTGVLVSSDITNQSCDAMDDLGKSFSFLKFVPASIRFGRGGGRGRGRGRLARP